MPAAVLAVHSACMAASVQIGLAWSAKAADLLNFQ